jgi:molybdate transport system ATP-binding protein
VSAVAGVSVRLHQTAPIPLAAEFSCAPGEVLALVGPSGSGKSTVLRSIAGTYRPREGMVCVNGATWFHGGSGIHVLPHRRAVGMVFQNYALFPHMTALGNVMAAMTHVAAGERKTRASAVLELVHLAGLDDRRPAELSGGQQQRVAVARALARNRKSCCSMSPSRQWTRPHANASTVKSRSFGASLKCPLSWSRTISTRRRCSPTA